MTTDTRYNGVASLHATTRWEYAPPGHSGDLYMTGNMCPECGTLITDAATMCKRCAPHSNAVVPSDRLERHHRFQAIYHRLAGNEWNEAAFRLAVERMRE